MKTKLKWINIPDSSGRYHGWHCYTDRCSAKVEVLWEHEISSKFPHKTLIVKKHDNILGVYYDNTKELWYSFIPTGKSFKEYWKENGLGRCPKCVENEICNATTHTLLPTAELSVVMPNALFNKLIEDKERAEQNI